MLLISFIICSEVDNKSLSFFLTGEELPFSMYSKFKNTFTDTILSIKIKVIGLDLCGDAMPDLKSK